MAGKHPKSAPVSRLLPWLRPYRATLGLGVLSTTIASLLDGAVLLLLIPLIRHLFGSSADRKSVV